MREIPLTQGKVALIDDKDSTLALAYVWHAALIGGIWYAGTNIQHPEGGWYVSPDSRRVLRKTKLLLHQLIMGVKYIDHVNGDGLDNRRCNLRIATRSQNKANSRIYANNTSGFKGVSWNAHANRWQANITIDRKQSHLGYFDDPILAALSYDDAARELFCEYARPNFAFGPDSLIPEQFTSDDPCPGGQEVTT